MRSIFMILGSALLAGCLSQYVGDEKSPYYPVPVGARVTLTQPLTIAPDQVGVFIQDGRVVPQQEVRNYYPHCKFEVYTLRSETRTVAPDEFVVSRTVQEYAHSAMRDQAGRIQLAAGGLRFSMFSDDDMDILVTFATRMYLKSDKQPDVFRLTCAQWGHMPGDRHVTIAEMRQTLGSLLTLQLPPPRPAT